MLGLGLQVCRLEAEATASSALLLWVVLYTEHREMRKQVRIELEGDRKDTSLDGGGEATRSIRACPASLEGPSCVHDAPHAFKPRFTHAGASTH